MGRAGRSGSRRARSLIDLAGFDPDQPRDTAGRWFHGTAAVLKPGDILRPGRVLGKKNFDYESHHADNDAVFITDQISKALGYGRLSKADDSGTYTKAPHVYEVTPVGVLNPDPRDPGSWRAGAARVVREVHPRPNRNARRKEAGLPLLPDEPAPMYDLANPSLDRTRRITSQILNGEDPAQLLRQRGVYGPVADAVVKLAGEGTAHRPNARRGPHPLTLPIRIERDREALYRGAYMLKASERIETSIEEGLSLKQAVARERRFQQAHETARRNRLEAVVKAQRVAMRFGERVDTPSGPRTLVGWYLNPLLNNDPECVAADGHNFYAEEGTVLGFPGGVHMNCGCIAGPPIEGAGMVDAAVRGVVPITSIPSRPKFTKKRKARMSA